MDIMDLTYEDKAFDLVIDKSTIDALLCGDYSFSNVALMTKEIQRVTKIAGIYMVISYGQPENRLMHLVNNLYNYYRKEIILAFQLIFTQSKNNTN